MRALSRLALGLPLLACAPRHPPVGDETPADASVGSDGGTGHAATVSHHVDGDTLDVVLEGAETRIRLRGVDTPEIHGEGAPEPWGEAADVFTREAAPLGGAVGIEVDEEACLRAGAPSWCFSYDRLLAYVRLADERDLGAELLARGLATFFDDDYTRREEYLALERQARADGVGIWSD